MVDTPGRGQMFAGTIGVRDRLDRMRSHVNEAIDYLVRYRKPIQPSDVISYLRHIGVDTSGEFTIRYLMERAFKAGRMPRYEAAHKQYCVYVPIDFSVHYKPKKVAR